MSISAWFIRNPIGTSLLMIVANTLPAQYLATDWRYNRAALRAAHRKEIA
jgi:hypothetical protein